MKFSNSIFIKICTLTLFLSFSSSASMAQNGGEPADSSFWYQISNMWKGDGLVLELIEDGKCNCQLQLAAPNKKAKGQYWRFKQVREGWYRIFNRLGKGKKCLESKDGVAQLGERGRLKTQLWRLVSNGDGFVQLHTMTDGKNIILDVKNDGKNTVFMGNNKNLSGQFWKLTKIRPRQNPNKAKNQNRGRNSEKTTTTNRPQETQVHSLKTENRTLQPEVAVASKTLLTRGTQLKPRTLPLNWWAMNNPLILQSKEAVLLNGNTLVPANSNMRGIISKNKQEEYFLELVGVEVGGKYHAIKTNKVQITNTGDLFSPYIGSEANFEVPIETSIPIVLEENVDLK